MKKFASTQEMANIYPDWTKVRTDDQSVGYQLLNSFASPMDKMDKSLRTMKSNYYLDTANHDEIDLTYKVLLPTTFKFEEDTSDPLLEFPVPPTVVGNPGVDDFPVNITSSNSVREFWYESTPNRFSVGDTRPASPGHVLLTMNASETPKTVELKHHLKGGKIWVETTGGTEYLKNVDGVLTRAKIILRGETRKGTEESETIIFPWDMKQQTKKDWAIIEKVEVFDMEPGVLITIRSGDFDNGPYIDQFNIHHSNERRKIDTFWDLGEVEGNPTIDMVRYITDQWENIALGFSEKEVVQSWELLDKNNIPVTGVDMALQPFTDRAWVASSDGKLHLYDILEDMVSGVDMLKERTAGSHVQFEYDTRYLVKDEDFVFIPWHARPLKEIISYRIWYQTPSGTKFGILDGVSVPFTSNFVVKGEQLERTIANEITITLTERGEYLFVLEATFIDKEKHVERIIVKTNCKKPLATLDISSQIPTVTGLDFDSDQKLWAGTTISGYYRVDPHSDIMLIDYSGKIIYFKERYDEVDITTP